MQALLLVLQIFFTGFAVSDFSRPSYRRILNGNDATIEEFPYLIQIFLKGGNPWFLCGGSIIGKNLVITAAHCFAESGNKINRKKDHFVRSGVTFKSGQDGTKHYIKDLIVHELYNSTGLMNNDIAILRVDPPFEMGPTRQRIPISRNPPKTGDIGVVAGWGYLDKYNTVPTNVLKKTTIPIIGHNDCKRFFRKMSFDINPGNICTKNGKSSTRQGDSGGPLTRNGKLVGIVSFGQPTYTGMPTGYTSLRYHQSWIKKKVEKFDGADLQYG